MNYPLLFLLFVLTFGSLCRAETAVILTGCPNNEAAKLVALQGKLFVDPKSNGQWHVAQLDEYFCEGSRMRVDAYSRVTIRLPSGIVFSLNEGSIFTLNEIAPKKPTVVDLLKGYVHFISRTPMSLTIKSPIANAGPEGTEFAMGVDDKQVSLWVYEGGVRFFNNLGSIRLKPGQGGQALAGQAPKAQIDIKPQDAVNWALYYPPILPYPDRAMAIDGIVRTAIDDFRQGHVDVALTKLDKLPLAKQTPYFFKVRAAMRLTVGLEGLALQDIKALLANNPNDAEALALQSIRSLTQNRKDEAYALANRAVTADPHSATAYSALSYAEQARFELDKALQAAEQATKAAPHDAMVWARKAEIELALGLTSESDHTARRALELDATLERIQTVMGFSHLLRMDTDEALQSFEKAVKLDSSSPLARLGLGLAKIRQGDLEAGRQDLEIAAALDPNNSLIRSYLGKAYYEEKRNSLAEDQFNLAKLRDAKDPTPYFYDAIRKQTINRPVEALYDMQKAIELNDNRAVFRSKLMLDKDVAAREAGLGRIYNSLGFDDVANRQAMKALAIDPSNYSAHRLSSDSYATKPRQEIARASEHLQSQLLQPLNYNPIQPSLAYTDLNIIKGVGVNDIAFNEYNRLFERNGVRLTATGIAGSNNTFGDEAALSGIINKFSYSLGQLHYKTDGFRDNNDLKHNLYNAFTQYEITPNFSIQAEYRHRETDDGFLELRGKHSDIDLDRRNLKQDIYRFGAKFTPEKHSKLLFSFIYSDRSEFIDFGDQDQDFPSNRFNTNNKGYQLESQYLFNKEFYNVIVGIGTNQFDVNRTRYAPNYASINNDPNCSIKECIKSTDFEREQYFGYTYSNVNFHKNLTGIFGVSYDYYNDGSPGNNHDTNQLSPKFGIKWDYNNLLLRLAFFQSVKSPIVVNQTIQPIQIAGFNQFYDDENGTKSTQYSIGLDTSFLKNLYSGIEAVKRDLDVPVSGENRRKEEELYRFYINWIPHENWVINSEFRFENYRGQLNTPKSVETAYIPLNLRYFNSQGFFANLGGTYINQTVQSAVKNEESFKSSFFLVDASIGYRFPKQYGLISLDAKNLLDKNFKFRDRNFQMNEKRTPDILPERTFLARISINF